MNVTNGEISAPTVLNLYFSISLEKGRKNLITRMDTLFQK